MRKLPWAAVLADVGLTACCVIACVNAMPTAFDVPYTFNLPLLASVFFALILCPLIHWAKKAWPVPCLAFAFLTALYGVLMRRAVVSGAKLLWYSAAWLLALDYSSIPSPSIPEAAISPAGDVTAFLVLAAAVLTLVTAVLVIKPKSPIPALLVPFPAFALCFVYTDCRPAVFAVALLVIYLAGTLFGRELIRKDVRTAGPGRLFFLLLLGGCAIILAFVMPEKKYEPIPFSERKDLWEVLGTVRDDLFQRQNNNPREVDLAANGNRDYDEEKVFSVNCSRRGSYLLRTHSYGRYTGAKWVGAEDYSGEWCSLEALGTTQSGSTAVLRVRDAYMNERVTPYAFSPKQELSVGEAAIRANGRDAYVWNFMPELVFRPEESTKEEEEYYRFALKQYTIPDGELKDKLLRILDYRDMYFDAVFIAQSLESSQIESSYTVDPDRVYELALRVAGYVRSSGTYTLTPGRTPENVDFVEYFLMESHRGYCVHFASATTALLQAMGVPARYVVGYSVTVDKADTWIDVPRHSAHAWTEVYVKGVGWVPVESSAGFPSSTGYSKWYEGAPSDPKVTDAPFETRRPINVLPDDEFTPDPTQRPTPRPSVAPGNAVEPAAPTEVPVKNWLIPLAVILALAGAWEGFGAFIRARRNRLFNQQDSRAAVLAMLKYLDRLIRYGADVPENAEELAQEARYSNHSMKENQKELLELVRRNREILKKHSPIMRFILKWVTFRL